MSPTRQFWRRVSDSVPAWLGVPLALFLAAILGVALVSIVARLVFP